MRLYPRIVIATAAIVMLVAGLGGGFFLHLMRTTLTSEIGENALNIARSVAALPQIRKGLSDPDPVAAILPVAESVRLATGAAFVVVGDDVGIRVAHPEPDRIGLPMVGGDNAPALVDGQEYVSVATGSLGRSMRGKVPVLSEAGEIIGVVSVGFMLSEVEGVLRQYTVRVLIILGVALLLGVVGALLLAHSIKRAIHGMEPEEIGTLVQQRGAILGAIREGIVAIGADGRIEIANETASRLVPGLVPGAPVLSVLPHSRLPHVLQVGEPEFDQEMLINDTIIVVNRVPVRIGDRITGVVATFRDRHELDRLYQELSDIRRYTDTLRAQAHEFANTMQAVSGMLQLGEYEEAVDFIQAVTAEHRELVEGLPETLHDPAVTGLLLGKWARAAELHCRLVIDASSKVDGKYENSALLVRILGNLIDNAFDAVQELPTEERKVRVHVSTIGGDVRIEVEDSGRSVPPGEAEHIFNKGFSTKGPDRGLGLGLVLRLVRNAGGAVHVRTSSLGGASFHVAIPAVATRSNGGRGLPRAEGAHR